MRVELVERLGAGAGGERWLPRSPARCGELRLAVADHAEMSAVVGRMIDAARGAGARYSDEEIDETVAFLEWLREHHFVFLGTRDYAIVEGPRRAGTQARSRDAAAGSCETRSDSTYAEGLPLSHMSQGLRERIEGGDLLLISKTNRPVARPPARAHGLDRSQAHRRDRRRDRRDPADRAVHLARVHGAGGAHAAPAAQAPAHRRGRGSDRGLARLQGDRRGLRVVPARRAVPGRPGPSCAAEVMAVLQADETHIVSVAQRLDATGRGRRGARRDAARPLQLGGAPAAAGAAARALRRRHGRLPPVARRRRGGPSLLLGAQRAAARCGWSRPSCSRPRSRAACRTWDDDLVERLVVEHGDVRGSELAAYYAQRFPDYYKTATHPDLATLHVRLLERVRAGEPFAVGLQNEQPHQTHEGARAADAPRRREARRQDVAVRAAAGARGARADRRRGGADAPARAGRTTVRTCTTSACCWTGGSSISNTCGTVIERGGDRDPRSATPSRTS